MEGEDDYGDEEEHEMMHQMQQQQMMQQQMMQQQQDEEDEDDEDKTLIELDDLDENDKEMLLQYLQQEFEKNPDQFPFPKELLQGNFNIQQQQQHSQSQKEDSIKDIKSEEMIVEDAQPEGEDEDEGQDEQIMGGEQ